MKQCNECPYLRTDTLPLSDMYIIDEEVTCLRAYCARTRRGRVVKTVQTSELNIPEIGVPSWCPLKPKKGEE